jgi:DNA-binding transcriptional MocR family regulator
MPLDWSKVTLPAFDNTKVQVNKIGDLDYAKLLVIAQLTANSQSQIGQAALYTYLKDNWGDHEERLLIEANKRNLTLEECFQELVKEAIAR